MQVDEDEHHLMSREELYNKIVTLTGGQAAEQLVFHSITTGASNDIEKATRLARGMITRYGMGDFGMVALETLNSQYLGQDTSLACSPAFAEKIDEQVVRATQRANYRWVKTPNAVSALGESWHLLKMPTMNCESWLMPSYAITEFSRHCTLRDASWAAAACAGKICSPVLGDFGVGVTNWLNLGGQIYPDGRRYVAKVVYKASPDPAGWDTTLYESAEDEATEEQEEEE